MVGEVTVDLLQPKLMSQIVDKGVLGGNFHFILTTGIFMLLLAAAGGIAGTGAAGFASGASQNFGNDLRCDAFQCVMNFSLEQTDKFTTGSLVTRLTNDITMLQDFVEMVLRMFIRAPLSFLGGIVMALSLNVNFGLVLIISLPLQLVMIWIILNKASPLFSIVQKKLDKVNSVVQENVNGARIVKAYVREDYEIGRFGDANNDLMNTTLKVQKLMAVLNPALMIIMNFSVIAIIYIGGLQVNAKAMQVGQVMAAITYVTQILMSVMMVGMMFQTISRAKASSLRIQEILDTKLIPNGSGNISETSGGSVCFKNVSFNYPGLTGQPVLQDVSLKINSGETVAILGATGSGKTTLVNLIPRFYEITDGKIEFDGIDVKTLDLEELRSKIGFVLQNSELFSGTVEDNIRWGNKNASENDVKAAASIAQADEYITRFKDGYQTLIGEKGASLSGGQKQRLCIARAIVKRPELLIFDDSTSALDLGTEARLHEALKKHLGSTTVIMIAQRIASVMDADKIAVLDNGRLIAFGTHEQLFKDCAVYQDIYNSQDEK